MLLQQLLLLLQHLGQQLRWRQRRCCRKAAPKQKETPDANTKCGAEGDSRDGPLVLQGSTQLLLQMMRGGRETGRCLSLPPQGDGPGQALEMETAKRQSRIIWQQIQGKVQHQLLLQLLLHAPAAAAAAADGGTASLGEAHGLYAQPPRIS